MRRPLNYCMLSILAAMALSGCGSEAGDTRSSVPLGQSLDTQPPGPAGATVPRTGSQPRLGRDAVEAIGSPWMTEVDVTEEWRTSIRLRSRVRLVDSTTLPDPPFEGIVQLRWSSVSEGNFTDGQSSTGWQLWFYQYDYSGVDSGWTVGYVPLPHLSVDCVGDVGLVSRGAEGVEVGAPPWSANASFLVPWGGAPKRREAPSQQLLESIALRPSNVTATAIGDILHVGEGDGRVSYVLRTPARADGELWEVQARHDGEVFVMTVHPARHDCFSGVTWLSVAETGELLACGADTAATKYVNSEGANTGRLELPAADDLPEYLECAYPLSHHSLR